MIKHTQTTHWQQLTNCLSVFNYFVGLALKVLRSCEFKKKKFHFSLNFDHQNWIEGKCTWTNLAQTNLKDVDHITIVKLYDFSNISGRTMLIKFKFELIL